MAAPTSPKTNNRLCPHKSPALPKAGPTTPKASNGPVITQLITETLVPTSSATVFRLTTSRVIVKLTVNTLASRTRSVALRCVIETRRVTVRRKSRDHGMTEISSTPPESMIPSSWCDGGCSCSSSLTTSTVVAASAAMLRPTGRRGRWSTHGESRHRCRPLAHQRVPCATCSVGGL